MPSKEREDEIKALLVSLKPTLDLIHGNGSNDKGVSLAYKPEFDEEFIKITINNATYTVLITCDSLSAVLKDIVDTISYKL